jgi:hypothetical protein
VVVFDETEAIEAEGNVNRELSTISKTEWHRPSSRASPMYILGRWCTPSKSSSFWILDEF